MITIQSHVLYSSMIVLTHLNCSKQPVANMQFVRLSNSKVKTLRSTITRYEITCKFDGCPWRLYAASIGGAGNKFRIRTYCYDHSCSGIQQLGHQQATAKFIGD